MLQNRRRPARARRRRSPDERLYLAMYDAKDAAPGTDDRAPVTNSQRAPAGRPCHPTTPTRPRHVDAPSDDFLGAFLIVRPARGRQANRQASPFPDFRRCAQKIYDARFEDIDKILISGCTKAMTLFIFRYKSTQNTAAKSVQQEGRC